MGCPVLASFDCCGRPRTEARENLLIGNFAPENFAQVVTLYTDKRLWDHLSINGLSFVEAHWSVQLEKGN